MAYGGLNFLDIYVNAVLVVQCAYNFVTLRLSSTTVVRHVLLFLFYFAGFLLSLKNLFIYHVLSNRRQERKFVRTLNNFLIYTIFL